MYKTLLFKTAFLFLLFLCTLPLKGQYENVSTQELKASALNDFKEAKYSSALEKFNSLISRYPKDGLFHYYIGVCQLMQNRSVPSAIESMKYAASRPNVPTDVWYFLGEAYMKNYQFQEAKKAYMQFNDVATKTELKEKNPVRKAEMALNAMELSKNYNSIDIIASSLFSFSDTGYLKQIKSAGGTLETKPLQFSSSYETKGDLASYSFIPENLLKGDYIFFSGYGRLKKWGTDIYRAKVTGQKKYSDPELLKPVNSEYNEILPYFDPVGEDLYFASDGYNSMGGYDIFKSHYIRESNTWTEPVNLGFPINSPGNEYIFIPGTDLGKAMLVTDRQGLDSMLTVYLLHIREPRKSSLTADNEELKKIGNFGGIESIPEIVNIAETGFPAEVPDFTLKPLETRPVIRQDIHSDEYSLTVKKALEMQFKSDSLAGLAKDARINVKSIPEPDRRWSIQSEIITWEKQASDYQVKANEYYAQLKNMEKEESVTVQLPPAISKDTVIKDITVFRFNPGEAEKSVNEKAAPAKPPEKEIVSAVVKEPAPVREDLKPAGEIREKNDFIILERSPYSSLNPFPHDIDIPSGTFYRIQLGVYSHKQETDAFGGVTPITTESIKEKALTRYYAGQFMNYDRAKSALNILKNKGYRDAFIVAWYNGRKLPPEKVAEFEKQ